MAKKSITFNLTGAVTARDSPLSECRHNDLDEKSKVDRCDWEFCDDNDFDDEKKFRCSSALGDRSPPATDSAEISACEPIQRLPSRDQVSVSSLPDEVFDKCGGKPEVNFILVHIACFYLVVSCDGNMQLPFLFCF